MMKQIFSVAFLVSLVLLPFSFLGAQAPLCVVDSFVASPTAVVSGGAATLTIKTTNCSKTVIFGLNPTNSREGLDVQASGSVSTGALTSDRKFTLEAGEGSGKVTKSLTVGIVKQAEAEIESEEKGFWASLGGALSALGGMVASVFSAIFGLD